MVFYPFCKSHSIEEMARNCEPAMTGPLKEQQLGEENPTTNPKGNGQESSKHPQALRLYSMDSKGQCSRGGSCSFKHNFTNKGKRKQKKIPFHFGNEREYTRKGDGKGDTKGARPSSHTRRYAAEGAIPEGIRMRCTHQNAHTTNRKVDDGEHVCIQAHKQGR